MKRDLTLKLLIYITLSSLCVTLLISGAQLYWEYQKAVQAVSEEFRFIEDTHLSAIAASAYDMDWEQLELQLKGTIKLENIVYLEVVESRSTGEIVVAGQGNPNTQRDISKEFRIQYPDAPEGATQYALLRVYASLESIKKQFWGKVWFVFLVNATQIFLASFFIFMIIRMLVTRHLSTMANYADQLGLGNLTSPLVLNRKKELERNEAKSDELDRVVVAINNMRLRIQDQTAELASNEERFRRLVSSLDALVYVSDMDTYELLFINDYGQRIWGEIVGKKCWQSLQTGQTGPCSFCTNEKLLNDSGEPTEVYIWEFQNTVDNEWYECRDQAIRWPDGRIVRMEIATNISKRKRAEEEKEQLENKLRQAVKMQAVGTMAGGIAHEFNNLLGVIMGCADMARDEVPQESFAKTQLDKVLQASYRVKDLVKQILTFSRQAQQKKNPADLCPLIKESLKLIRTSIPSSVEVIEDIRSCDNTIVDPTEIQQIIMNLCSNAVWAMNEKGVIDIRLQQVTVENRQAALLEISNGNYVELKFSDNGQGMDDETKAKVFDPFFTQKEVGEGTGMGLSIIYGIMKSYEGAITVKSEVGKGATFYLYFPITTQGAVDKLEAIEKVPKGTERILYVDDEEIYAEMGSEMICRLGYDVDLHLDSNKALEAFKASPDSYDLVITDQIMPQLSGEELVREIRKIRLNLPIILCTGYSSQIDDAKAMSIGINAFVYKPISKKDIAQLIRKMLDTH